MMELIEIINHHNQEKQLKLATHSSKFCTSFIFSLNQQQHRGTKFIVKLQPNLKVKRLGVDFVLHPSQQEEEQEEPSPKIFMKEDC